APCACRDFVPKSKPPFARRPSPACRASSTTWTARWSSCYKPSCPCAPQDDVATLMTVRSQPFSEDLPERPKVLLVDDDEVNLLLTSVALEDQGFSVTEAASGEAAIRVLAGLLHGSVAVR